MWSDNDGLPTSSSANRRRNNDRNDITLANTQGQLLKTAEQLNEAKQTLAAATNKLHNEEARCVQLEEQLRKRTEEFRQEQLLRENQETALDQANTRAKEAEVSRKYLEQQLDALSSAAASNRQQTEVSVGLQKQVRDLQAEIARLHSSQLSRPHSSLARGRPSTTSSIPVPKGKKPRSSSLTPETSTRRLEDDLRATRATLASTQSTLQAAESKLSNKTDSLLKAENEKFALERRFAAERVALQSALEEAQDELKFAHQTVDTGVSREEYERALRAEDAARAELVSMTARNRELEGKLQRKTGQLAAAQERLDELQFQNPSIQEALQEARNEAARAKEQLALFKTNVKGAADCRESLEQTRQALQDKSWEVEALQRELQCRGSNADHLEAQRINETGGMKDLLMQSERRREEAEANLVSARDQVQTLQHDLTQCESNLQKARKMIDQHRALWQEIDHACTAAEKRAVELEAQLDKLHEEVADRSTISEARERNRQWTDAVERVQTLEHELELAQRQRGEDELTPKMKPTALLLPESNEEEVEVLERLLAAVDRLRAERDQLRRDAAFLKAEAKAIEHAVDATVEEHRQMDLQRVKVVEKELEVIRVAVLEKDARIAELTSESALEQRKGIYFSKAVEALATVVQRYDFIGHHSSINTFPSTAHTAPLINIDNAIHSFLSAYQRPPQPPADESSGSWLAESALQQPTQIDRAFAIHEDPSSPRSGSGSATDKEDQCEVFNFDPQPTLNQSPRAHPYSSSASAKYIEELELRVDRRTEQIGVHQHEISRLQTNLRIAEETIDSMRLELELLRSERACLEEDAHHVRESWAFDKQALEKVDAELDEVKGELERRGEGLLERDSEILEVLKVFFDGICKHRMAIVTVGRLREEMRTTRATLEEQVQSREREARRLSSLNKLANIGARSHERDLEELDKQLQNARGSLKASETLVADLESRLQEVEKTRKDMVKGHEQAIEALNTRLVDAEIVAATAFDARKAEEAKHAVLLGKVEELKVALEVAQKNPSTKELGERLIFEEKHRKELKERLEAEKEGAIILQAEVRRLKEEIQRYSELDQELDGMLAILNDERQAYSSLESEFNTLEAKHIAFSAEFKEAQARFEQCNAELTEKRTALEAAESKSSDIALLQAQMNGLQKKLAQSEEALVEARQAASAAASTTVCDAEANIKIIQLETQVGQMQEEVRELTDVCEYKSNEIEKAEDRIIELLQERRKLSNKVDSLSRKLRDASRTVEELQAAPPFTGPTAPTNDGPEPRPIVNNSASLRAVSAEICRPSSSQIQQPTSLDSTKAPSRSSAPSIFSPLASDAPVHRQAAGSTTRPTSSLSTAPEAADSGQVPLAPSREHGASPQHPVENTTPGSAGRKRRLPDDFDPNPEERLPPAPVLASTTPSRLRRAMLRDGTVPRNGFTPSRTRTTSATTSDRDAAITAANAAWIVNMGIPPAAPVPSLGGDKYPTPSIHSKEDTEIPQGLRSNIRPSTELLTSTTPRPRSRVAVYPTPVLVSGEQPSRSSRPMVGKPRAGGWLRGAKGNRSGPSGTNAVASSDSDAKVSSGTRRTALSALNLGVGELGMDIPVRKADGAPGYAPRTKSRRLE